MCKSIGQTRLQTLWVGQHRNFKRKKKLRKNDSLFSCILEIIKAEVKIAIFMGQLSLEHVPHWLFGRS